MEVLPIALRRLARLVRLGSSPLAGKIFRISQSREDADGSVREKRRLLWEGRGSSRRPVRDRLVLKFWFVVGKQLVCGGEFQV